MLTTNSTKLQAMFDRAFDAEPFAIENACQFLRQNPAATCVTIPATVQGGQIQVDVCIAEGAGFYTRLNRCA